jgi:hypothetical protein
MHRCAIIIIEIEWGVYRMCFPMTHLCVAYDLMNNIEGLEHKGDYMLGVVAPDSVHFRNPYSVEMKKKSHIWYCGETWGITLDHEKWHRDILSIFSMYGNSRNRDFIYGYCVHLLTDWSNDDKIWTPFREASKEESFLESMEVYHTESALVDYQLYKDSSYQKEIMLLLEEGTAYDIPGVVRKCDIEVQREYLLNEEFNNPREDISVQRYCTLSELKVFMEETVALLSKELQIGENRA